MSNLARHTELDGSNDLNAIRQEPSGPVGLGTHVLAEKTVIMADGTGMDLTVVNLKGILESGGGGMFGWPKKIFGS